MRIHKLSRCQWGVIGVVIAVVLGSLGAYLLLPKGPTKAKKNNGKAILWVSKQHTPPCRELIIKVGAHDDETNINDASFPGAQEVWYQIAWGTRSGTDESSQVDDPCHHTNLGEANTPPDGARWLLALQGHARVGQDFEVFTRGNLKSREATKLSDQTREPMKTCISDTDSTQWFLGNADMSYEIRGDLIREAPQPLVASGPWTTVRLPSLVTTRGPTHSYAIPAIECRSQEKTAEFKSLVGSSLRPKTRSPKEEFCRYIPAGSACSSLRKNGSQARAVLAVNRQPWHRIEAHSPPIQAIWTDTYRWLGTNIDQAFLSYIDVQKEEDSRFKFLVAGALLALVVSLVVDRVPAGVNCFRNWRYSRKSSSRSREGYL